MKIKKIGIIGAGPAGAYCAYKLAQADFEVLLFDHKAPWNKPCAGGIAPPTLEWFPDLIPVRELALANQRIRLVLLNNENFFVELLSPIYVLSRKVLGDFQLGHALKAGVNFLRKKVLDFSPDREGFLLQLDNGETQKVDFLIGADGVQSRVRKKFCPVWNKLDYTFTVSLWIEQKLNLPLTFWFHSGLIGYSWIFPGADGFSIGIGSRNTRMSPELLFSLLEKMLQVEPELNKFKTLLRSKAKRWLIPALSFSALRKQQVVGENWALIGDASGTANWVTGGGITYAYLSAQMLAESLTRGKPQEYQQKWWEMCKKELAGPSLWGPIFYQNWTQRIIIQMLKKSETARKLVKDELSGIKPGRAKVLKNLFKALTETYF